MIDILYKILNFSETVENSISKIKEAFIEFYGESEKKYIDDKFENLAIINHGLLEATPNIVTHIKELRSAEYINKFRESAKVLIMPHDLVYLHRGGRISGLSYAVASAVSIKPLITLEDGILKNVKKVIGTKAALMEFVKLAKQENSDVYLVEVYESPYTNELVNMINKTGVSVKEVFKMDPVIGCHVGPGGIAMGIIKK